MYIKPHRWFTVVAIILPLHISLFCLFYIPIVILVLLNSLSIKIALVKTSDSKTAEPKRGKPASPRSSSRTQPKLITFILIGPRPKVQGSLRKLLAMSTKILTMYLRRQLKIYGEK